LKKPNDREAATQKVARGGQASSVDLIWSAPTCQRFGRRRLVAAFPAYPQNKAATSRRTPKASPTR